MSVTNNTAAVLKEVTKQASRQLEKFCIEMSIAGADEAPVAEKNGGNLRDSITFEVKGLEGKVYTETGKKDGGDGYGFWVHEGHTTRSGSQVAPNPYFRRAFEAVKGSFGG